MKTKLFFGMLTAAATLAVAPAAFAGTVTDSTSNGSDGTYTTTTGSTTIGTVEKEYQRNYNGSWTGTSVTTTGTVEGYELTIKTGSSSTDLDIYFTGEGTLTITNLTVDNGTTTGATYKTTKAFIVEGTTVILDGTGVNVTELGMNLVVGTEYGVGDATLIISGGAKVSTGAYYSTVGSNLATGTITITGEGSTLSNQQITLGGGVNSMFPGSIAASGDYWTKYFVDTDTYNDEIRDVLVSSEFVPTSGSYGIVNVEKGGTWKVGVGNTDPSNSRLQLSNGEVNIDGGSLIFGTGSSLMMCNENLFSASNEYGIYTEMNVSEKVTVTNGGTVSVETDAAGDAQTMTQLVVGETYVGENVVAEISVDGKGSSFIISAKQVYIGSDSGYYTSSGIGTYNVEGGSSTTKILATDGGVIDIFAAVDPLIICADNYASYIGSMSENVIMKDAKSSHGLDVEIKASYGEDGTNGSTISLGSVDLVLLGGGSPAEGYENNIAITADGAGSSVSISGTSIYANYGTNGTDASEHVHVTFTASNGGEINLTATGTKTGDGIALNKNTSVIVEGGSSLKTVGAVLFNEGSSISVDGTSKWAGGDVEFASGSLLSITAGASAISTLAGDASANVSLGNVTISEGASIIVTIDISSLGDYTEASVAILTAESIVFDYVAETEIGTTLTAGTTTADSNYSDTLASFVTGYIVCEENGFELNSWSYEYDNGTYTLYANIRTMPEPSMFGMLFGLSALGLVSTRRRRRKA